MRSIRRGLILNVTLLLIAALGIVAALVYRITEEAIQEKQRAMREQTEMKFEEQRDEAMLAQARAIASDAQSQFDPARFQQYLETVPPSVLAMSFGPNAHVTAPVWLAQHMRWSVSFRLAMLAATDIKLNDIEAMGHGYVQVNSDWGKIWRSRPMPSEPLPLDMAAFSAEERFQWFFDDIELTPGQSARRVRLKAPLFRNRVQTESGPERASLGIAGGLRRDPFRPDRLTGPPWYASPGGSGGPRKGPSPSMARPPSSMYASAYLPTLYIQVAWDSGCGDPLLAELQQKRDEQLARIDADNRQAMASLKERLFWIALATVAIALVGGWLLVGAGLAPLKRLSTAVSQVSAKDFHLPIEPGALPREISPVAERFHQTLRQLSEAFAREKRASADISHELRTPLAALATTLDVALRKPRAAESYRQTIEEARVISRQISQLVDRMLKLAWLDAGADEARPEPVDLDALVEGCAAIGRPLAEAQGLEFQVRAERPMTVRTDPDKMREIVMNLLHNAIEYNRPGGKIELNTRATDHGVVVEVSDTGIGIAPEMQAKIFERFFRGDPSRNAAGAHAGLGLAIVKEYVDRLGGTLSIESQVGAGSLFRVELPNA
jgi:signal transduction histidine kinase